MPAKILALSRWKEHFSFTIPLTLFGYAIGAKYLEIRPHFLPISLALTANILAISFAFMVNEIEDAPDDKAAGKKNPVADKLLSVNEAWLVAIITLIASATLYFYLGDGIFVAGGSILILALLYSWKTVRLKALPIVDILSHILMLAGLILIVGYLVSGAVSFSQIAPLFFACVLGSSYGQFFNQIRDFEGDKKAGLKNTSILIGKPVAKTLMYSSIFGALGAVVWAFTNETLPGWLIVAVVLLTPAVALVPQKISKRDRQTGVKTVAFHLPFQIALTLASLILLYSL